MSDKDDCISRQWLMECVSEGWIKFDTKKDENRFMHLVRDIAPSAQPEPTQEMQDILDYLNTVLHPIVSPEHWDVYSRLHDMVSSLPSAQPEHPKGHWIVWGGMDIPENHGRHICSLCGEFAPVRYEKPLIKENLSNFCPNCGADMRGGGE